MDDIRLAVVLHSLQVRDLAAYAAWVPFRGSPHHTHCSCCAVAAADIDMLDLDWYRAEHVVRDNLHALVVAARMGHSPFELADQAYRTHADQNDDLVESPDASSSVQHDLGLDSLNVVVMQHAGDMPVKGSENTWACADIAAEVYPCRGRLMVGEPSSELPSAEFEYA